MEDKEVVHYTLRGHKITAMVALKMLEIANKLYQKLQERQGNRVYTSEVSWEKMMKNVNLRTDVKSFKSSEINLDKLKNELAKYKLGFAFYKVPNTDKVLLSFYSKDSKIIGEAFKDAIEGIVKDDKFVEKTKHTVRDMKPAEKLNYYKENRVEMNAEVEKTVSVSKDINNHSFDDVFREKSKSM